ncbi:hypothetical protein Q3G72_033063 [Acer saccharum]|nr:hypothetical protein Q3G72_033063 [Acer saccharum]
MERADWLEDLEAVTICSKPQENDSRKRGVAGQVRGKSSSLDSQSNHRAWTKGDVKEDRGGIQVPSDVSRERNIKLMIGKSRRDLRRGESEEKSSWTSSEAESGELIKNSHNQWKGECSKSVGPENLAQKVLQEGPTIEVS